MNPGRLDISAEDCQDGSGHKKSLSGRVADEERGREDMDEKLWLSAKEELTSTAVFLYL